MGVKFLAFYIGDRRGAVTAEFVVISFALFMIIFFVVELTLLYFFTQSAQKAAHMGARAAIVSDPAAPGVPSLNVLAEGGIFGSRCNEGHCAGFDTLTCIGGGTDCNPDSFARILGRMQSFMPGLEAQHVTIRYAYQRLGYAGGPVIPAVTVMISDVPHQTGILGVVLGSARASNTIPTVTVTLTGEDLNTNGA